MIQKGEIKPQFLEIMTEVALCERFGWMPQIIEEMDESKLQEYCAVLRGWQKQQEQEQQK